ncbi:hypothetical protein [Pantoea sp. 18069]|uniref:hypothetical protein n=1 Tax=Pantoea sp. 18069 TaxID=2681415 RepID=UPI00135A1AEA|nr:hypothetical protein [Pantoea sp. 18069]
MRKLCAALFAAFAPMAAWAQVGRGGNLLHEDGASADGELTIPMLLAIFAIAYGIYKILVKKNGFSGSANFMIAVVAAIFIVTIATMH